MAFAAKTARIISDRAVVSLSPPSREAPAQYESYVDLIPGEWTAMRIEVQGTTAKLFVGEAPQPALIVNDLKRGVDAHGSVGLYVDNGTDGHFRRLRIQRTS